MKPWCFVHATDVHIGSPRSFRFAPAWNDNWQTARRQMIEIGPDLLLLGGDLARDGNLHDYELEGAKAEFDSLPFPYHVVPGNMDTGNKHTEVNGLKGPNEATDISLNLTSEQLRNFERVFGPSQWSFVHRNVRFSGLCDMLAGSRLPEEDGLWRWMESQRDQPRAEHHVWMMHSPLFLDDPREPNSHISDRDNYLDWYFNIDEPHRGRILETFTATGATIVISGHVHCRKEHFAEGIRFDLAPSTAFHQYGNRWPDGDPALGFLRYDVSDRGIDCAFVPLESVSRAAGYGPGGHPAADRRDYSIAWEK